MLTHPPLITIIIPTACTARRADSLRRAISSIQMGAVGIAKILVAANGPNVDADLAVELREEFDVRYVYFDEGSSPKTLASAVPLLDTEYFGFLDDDDELLPSGLTRRLAAIQNNPDADILLSNGYFRKDGSDSLCLHHLDTVPENPLEAFFTENWLPSCGALFRSSSVGKKYFENYHPYAEWSWLAFRLAMDQKRFCVLNEPTFRVHADTPLSLSKSPEYKNTYVSLYHRMLDSHPPKHIRKILRKRLSQAHHDLSAWYLGEGEIRIAIRHHLFSLKVRSGWCFLPFSWHIVAAAIKR